MGFLGIGTEHYDLATRIAEYSGELPYGLIPIADTEGGNLICIKVSGVGLGSIWFWDHEFEGDAAARKVADSLDEFIAGLREYEDDDPEPQVISSWVNPEFLEKLKRDGLIK